MSKDVKVVRKKAVQICGRRALQATSTMREQLVRKPVASRSSMEDEPRRE